MTHESLAPPNPTWRAQAAGWAARCVACLWGEEGGRARDYLHRRGLFDGVLRTFNVGYNPRDTWEDHAQWGLPKPQGGDRGRGRIWIPRGITFPWTVEGEIWRLNIRRPLTPAQIAARRDQVHRPGRLCQRPLQRRQRAPCAPGRAGGRRDRRPHRCPGLRRAGSGRCYGIHVRRAALRLGRQAGPRPCRAGRLRRRQGWSGRITRPRRLCRRLVAQRPAQRRAPAAAPARRQLPARSRRRAQLGRARPRAGAASGHLKQASSKA